MKLILILPFIIELLGDDYLIEKGKKDIPTGVRIAMIYISLCIVYPVPYESFEIREFLKYLIIALIPYAFFDPALNLLRGKEFFYTGKTKEYDLILGKLSPWVVLVGRFIFVGVLLLIYYCL